jgi:hypothetical protein
LLRATSLGADDGAKKRQRQIHSLFVSDRPDVGDNELPTRSVSILLGTPAGSNGISAGRKHGCTIIGNSTVEGFVSITVGIDATKRTVNKTVRTV